MDFLFMRTDLTVGKSFGIALDQRSQIAQHTSIALAMQGLDAGDERQRFTTREPACIKQVGLGVR